MELLEVHDNEVGALDAHEHVCVRPQVAAFPDSQHWPRPLAVYTSLYVAARKAIGPPQERDMAHDDVRSRSNAIGWEAPRPT